MKRTQDPPGSDAAGGVAASDVVRRTVRVENRRGLHARAAAKFVKLAGRFDADIWVARGDVTVSGRSIMGIMMLAAGPGSEIELSATGPDAVAAIDALLGLIGRKFDED